MAQDRSAALPLDNIAFALREHASQELKEAGESAVPYLRKALDDPKLRPSIEATKRIEILLESAKGPSPDWARAARSTAVLEAIGGDDARTLLEAMAKGDAEALPTRAAKTALERLGGKAASWDDHWDAVGGKDEAAALRSAMAIVGSPKEALPLLKERFKLGLIAKGIAPPSAAAVNRVTAVLTQLDSADARELLKDVPKLVVANAKSALSPDGRLRIEITEKGVLQLVQAAGGKLIWRSQVGNGDARCVAFAPDGKTVAAGSGKGAIHVLQCASGEELMIIQGHAAAVVGISFSSDGKQLTSVDSKNAACDWDVATGQKIR